MRHLGPRTDWGDAVAWWVWLLVGWVLLAVLTGVVLGMVIRAAERRDLGRDRSEDAADDSDPGAE
ncbi:hypothetical protein [Geodermatophilus sp. CPCC 206100]|uniref:hypothetical protein n=1 Tax=Geodermatophilus sp. CPCC 206100 TaxID=3020054 RepID=UPI003AFFCE2B